MRTVNIMRVIWLCCYFISGIKANLKNRGEVGGNTDVRDNIENELSDMRIGFQRGNLTRMLDIQAKNNPEKSSTQHWTSLCCSGSLTFDCNDWILKEAELKKKEKLTIQGLTTEFVFEDHVGTNTNSYVYRDVKKHYEVILTKSKDTYGYYGQIISNCEDNNYVIEYCGTDRDGGELHGIKKIARSSEEFDTDTDAGTKLLKSGKLFTKGTNNNTLQHQKTLTRNKRKTGNIQKFDIKFYYTKSFEDHTVDVNGFIDQVVSSINQAFINSKVSVRVEAHCSELAPLSDSDPNLFQQFYTMKGTDTKLKGDADAAQLLYHLKTPHSKAHKRSTKFCNAFDVQNRMISIVEKDCALGILSSSHAIGHNLGIHHEEDSKAKFNSGHFSIMSRLKNRLNCFPTPFCLATNTGWAPTNVMQAEDIKVKAGFVVNGRRFKRSPNLQRNVFFGVSSCPLSDVQQMKNDNQKLLVSLQDEVNEVKSLISSLGKLECTYNNILYDATRSTSYTGKVNNYYDSTDKPGSFKNNLQSPDWRGEGWYRIASPAGNRIPMSSPGSKKCGAQSSGWIQRGRHPTQFGETNIVKFCYHYKSNACSETQDGKVTHCGEYFVYYLPKVIYKDTRYCTTTE